MAAGSLSSHQVGSVSVSWAGAFDCSTRTRVTWPRTARLRPSAYCIRSRGGECTGRSCQPHMPATTQSAESGSSAARRHERSAMSAIVNKARMAVTSSAVGVQCRASTMPHANQHAAAKSGMLRKRSCPFFVAWSCSAWPVSVLLPLADCMTQHGHCLLMKRLRKHVDEMKLMQPVPGVYHLPEITPQGYRVARDVNNLGRSQTRE